MATFGLIHGAWHGGWCWERLMPELEAHGHAALIVDLPIDEPNASTVTYADAALLDRLAETMFAEPAGHASRLLPVFKPALFR